MAQRTFLAILFSLLSAPLLRGAEPTGAEKVQRRGELIVLTWPHQESIFTHRMVNEHGSQGLGMIDGIDIDVMRLFAEHLGVKLQVLPVKPDFAALLPKLLAGDGDVVASSMTITEGRSRKVDFSAPYFEVHKVVITRRGSSIDEAGDLVGKVATVVPGTSHEEQLRSLFPGLEIRPVQFVLESYLAVAEGEADYTVVDSSSSRRILHQYSDLGSRLEVAFQFPEDDHFGYAVAPGSDLKAHLDRFLEEIRQSGKLKRIIEKHLDSPADPPS